MRADTVADEAQEAGARDCDGDVRIAVALRYSDEDPAPVVVATGRGETAKRIEALAADSGVAIEANPLLAQALADVPLDQTIPQELYVAVAEVIGWVLQNRSAADKHIEPSGNESVNS